MAVNTIVKLQFLSFIFAVLLLVKLTAHFIALRLGRIGLDCRIHKILLADVSGGPRRINVLNFIKIGRSIAAILRFCKFPKMAPNAILDFLNREISLAIVVERIQTHQHAKFHQNRSLSCEDIEIFYGFSKS